MTPAQHLTWDSRPGADGSTVHLPKYSEVEAAEAEPAVKLQDVVTGQQFVRAADVCSEDGHLYGCHPEFYDEDGTPGVIHPHGVFCKTAGCPLRVPA